MKKEFKVGDRVVFEYYDCSTRHVTPVSKRGTVTAKTEGGFLCIQGDDKAIYAERAPREVIRLVKNTKECIYVNIYKGEPHQYTAFNKKESAQKSGEFYKAAQIAVKYVRAKDQS